MRQLLKAMAPNSFDDVAALLALYRPGPMSVNMHYDYADRKNGRKPVEYFHDDAVEVLRRHVRPDDLSGERDAGGAEVRRLLARRSRQPAQGDGQEGPRGHGRRARGVRARRGQHGLRAGARQGALRHHREVRRLRLQQEPHVRLRPRSRTRPRTSRRTTRSSTSPACSPASRTTSTRRPSTSPTAAESGIKVLTPDINRSTAEFGALAPDELPAGITLPIGSPGAITFGLSAVRNVGESLVELLIAERDRERRLHELPRLRRAGARSRCSTSAPSSR